MTSLRFDVLTLFPEMFAGPLDESILGRARKANQIEVHLWDIRGFASDRHRKVDDTPYGGGAGMVMKPEPLVAAIEHVVAVGSSPRPPVVLLSPQGRTLSQAQVVAWAALPRLVLVCGRYEGVDERVRQLAIDDEISIGDYVLTGGELPAMVIIDAVARLRPGVLGGQAASLQEESFTPGAALLEYPQYTRPPEFRGIAVPEVLRSGHHGEVACWRKRESLRRTLERRPDLLAECRITEEERRLLREIWREAR